MAQEVNDFRAEICSFALPSSMFKTLRRLHGHNLENQGLNDLSEAFKNFVTRARFFSIGRLRRTWSHSAVEFLKYRRLLPMLTTEGQLIDDSVAINDCQQSPRPSVFRIRQDSESSTSSSVPFSSNEDKRIIVTNISARITTNQLASFFSKFGKVSNCQITNQERQYMLYGTLPKKLGATLIGHITFKKVEGAERAKNASREELKFYDKVMVVNSLYSSKRKSMPIPVSNDGGMMNVTGEKAETCDSGICTLADVAFLFGKSTSISALPLKSLTMILSHLPPIDRIRCERVSKNFLESAIQAWAAEDSLNFSSYECFSKKFSQSNPLRNAQLKGILARCGMHLKSISIANIVHLLDDKAFEIISSNCPNLEVINLSGLSGDWNTLRSFGDPLKSLKTFIYKDMVHLNDKSSWYLFKSIGENLQEVDLSGCRRIRGRFFCLFGESLQKIVLDGCHRILGESLEDLCLRAPNIIEIRLSGCWNVSDDIISLLSRHMSNLRTFSLCGDRFDSLSSSGLIALSRMGQIRDLILDHNAAVSDELIDAITKSMVNLRFLSLAYSGTDNTVSENGLSKIANLEKLKVLDISSLLVTNGTMTKIANGCSRLSVIRVRSCIYLGDDGVRACSNLKKLESLDLSGCLLVTSKALESLYDSFQLEENHLYSKVQMITVIVGGTICAEQPLQRKGSRIVIDTSDYSALSSNQARGFLSSSSGFMEKSDDPYSIISDDEFESLSAHRSFIIDALHGEEDDSPLENFNSINEWAKREALQMGLITE